MKKMLLRLSSLFAVFLLLSSVSAQGESIPVIIRQPANVTAYYSAIFKLSIQATGQNLQYQWEFTNDLGEWSDYYASTADSTDTEAYVSFGPIQPKYRCRVSNTAGIVYSREVVVTAVCPDIKIIKQPKSISVKEGQTAVYDMEFNINLPESVSLAWCVNGNYVSSSSVKDKKTSFQIPYIAMEQNGAQVQAQINWSCALDYFELKSSIATLTVLPNPAAPHITTQLPLATKVVSGTPVTLTVAASGANLTYEWWAKQGKYPYSNYQPFIKVGAGKSYTFTPIFTECYLEDYYIYAVVSNSAGAAKSREATVTALSPAPTIKKQPVSLTVKEGARATFTAEASASQSFLQFNWYKNGSKVFSEVKPSEGLASAVSVYSFSATSADKDAQVYCEVNSYSGGNHCVSLSPVTKTSVAKVTLIKDDNIQDCYAENIPKSADWVFRNEWRDQNNGSGLTDGNTALKIHHRQWGQEYFYIIGKNEVYVEKGKEYTFYIDAQGYSSNVDLSLTTGWSDQGPVNIKFNKTIGSIYNPETFTHHEVSFVSNFSGNVNVALKFSLSNLDANRDLLIKNIRVCQTIGNCIAEGAPQASKWDLRNDWNDQGNGSYLSNQSNALKVNLRAWNKNEFWVIGKTPIKLQAYQSYLISSNVKGAANAEIESIEAHFIKDWNNNGPVTFLNYEPLKFNGPLSSGDYTTITGSHYPTETTDGHLAFKFTLTSKPSVATALYIKDFSICGAEGIAVTGSTSVASSSRVSADLPIIALEDDSKEGVIAYPNPNEGKFSITFKESSVSRRLIVRDKIGTILINKEVANTDNLIDLGNAPSGIYLIQISSAEGLFTKTIVVK